MLAESAKYPATPNRPSPVPPCLAAGVSSAFASSIWSCTSNFTSSVMFLMMSPTARSATSAPLVNGEPTDLSTGHLPENDNLRRSAAQLARTLPQRDGALSCLRPPLVRRGLRCRQILLDQIHHRGVGQRSDIAQFPVLGNITEQPAHDLARTGLGQLLDHHDLARLGNRANLLCNMGTQLLDNLNSARTGIGSQDHERYDRLSSHRIVRSDDCGLGDFRVRYQRRFDLCRGHPVPGHIHHVIDPTEQPDVAVLVFLRPIAGEIQARKA